MRSVRKSYCQYCPVAHALDLVGERWSLLVVRELLHGPLRYTDLQERLPGIGTNILAARLRDLESAGILEKRKLLPPTPVTVYQLTAYGQSLQGVIAELARWGARSLGPPGAEVLQPGWLLYPLRLFTPADFDGRLEFRVGDEVAAVTADRVVEGPADEPDVVVQTDADGFYHLMIDGRSDGVRVEGDESVLVRYLERSAGAVSPQPA
jgi:DNA-binding HxlR family transcriptional regulator